VEGMTRKRRSIWRDWFAAFMVFTLLACVGLVIGLMLTKAMM
jgi:hypothetical protein